MSIIAYRPIDPIEWNPFAWDSTFDADEPDEPDGDAPGPADFPPEDDPGEARPPPPETPPPDPNAGNLPWVTCKEPDRQDPDDGGWREGTYDAGFMNGIPPRLVPCNPVIGSPIVLRDGHYVSEQEAHALAVEVLVAAGEQVQQWLKTRPGSALYPSSVICDKLREEMNTRFMRGRTGYRARQGTPCVF